MPERRGSFDGLATAYDRYRTGYSDTLYATLFGEGVDAGDRVLDLACGTGIVAATLAAYGCAVTGLDLSEPMLVQARSRVPHAAFVRGSAEAMPFADDAFDAATCAQAFHWFDAPRALAELVRVVRPGGVVAIWWKRFAQDEPLRAHREAAALAIGATPVGDEEQPAFDAFATSPLVDRSVTRVPWTLETTVGALLGYERSRANARDGYGARLAAYLDALAQRLGDPASALSVAYVQTLYLGRSPGG